jgi:hypothetical protein
MAKSVSKSEFLARVLHHLQQVEETGEALIITDQTRPTVRIEPYADDQGILERLRGGLLHYDRPLDPVSTDE